MPADTPTLDDGIGSSAQHSGNPGTTL